MATSKVLYIIGHSTIGLLLSLVHILHVSTLFENQTKFSHLSGLERELSLSPQEAFYYQFYKRLITANSMEDGINSLLADNLTQYDEVLTVNSLRRFHIMPEVVMAFLYRNFMSLANSLNIPTVNCYYVEPDENSSVDDPKVFVNCDGLGEAIYFYLAIIWSLSAITIFLLYMYGYFLHRNFVAGCAVIVYFFCTHESATNIHRTPMMRHNFAIPFIIWQTFYLNLYVDRHILSNDNNNRLEVNHQRNYAMITSIIIFSTIANLSWELSSNIFLTQALALFLVLQIQDKNGFSCIGSGIVFDFAVTQVISNCLCYFLMYGNIKFLISGNMSVNIALIVYLVRMKIVRLPTEEENINFRSPYKRFFYVLFFVLSTSWFIQDLMDRFAPYGQDSTSNYHMDLIFSMLHLKFPNFYSLLTYYKDNSHDLINIVTLRVYCLVFLFKNLSIFISIKFYQILHARRRKIDEDALEMQERAKNYVIEDFLETNRITMKDLSDPKTEKKIQENLQILEACNYDYQLFQRRKASKKIDLIAEKESFLNDIKKLKNQIQRGEKLKNESKTKVSEPCSSNDDESQQNTDDEETEREQEQKREETLKKEEPNKKSKSVSDSVHHIQPHYAFVLIQTALIAGIGLRFVLTPFLCLISATLPARSWFKRTSTTSYWIFYMFLVGCTFNYPGLKSLRYQYEYKSEFRNPELESLISWIEKTDQNAVFAAPLELSAHLLLTTKRPIANHPLIEYPDMIERTKCLYSIFSKRQSTEVYNQLVKLRVQFVVIPYESCFLSSKDGVRLIDIFDYIEPENYDKKAFCVSLFQKTNPTFLKVFENVKYIVIQIFSQSIQLELKKKSFPEVHM